MTVNVVNLDDAFNDLHASEWAQIIESIAKELSETVAPHEASMTANSRNAALLELSNLESCLPAHSQQDTVNKITRP